MLDTCNAKYKNNEAEYRSDSVYVVGSLLKVSQFFSAMHVASVIFLNVGPRQQLSGIRWKSQASQARAPFCTLSVILLTEKCLTHLQWGLLSFSDVLAAIVCACHCQNEPKTLGHVLSRECGAGSSLACWLLITLITVLLQLEAGYTDALWTTWAKL